MSCHPIKLAFSLAVSLMLVVVLQREAVGGPATQATTRPVVEPGFKPIFNGRDLDDWVYGMADNAMRQGAGYQVDPATGVAFCTVKDGGNLYTRKEYANFVLRFEFKLSENANNGIGIRAPLAGRTSQVGMEIQILDDSGTQYKSIHPSQYHGSIYDVVPAERGHLRPVGEWNSEEILADDRQIKVTLNGVVIVDANLDDVKDPNVLKRHPGLGNKTGHIGFLGHGARVEFRNLRVRELP